MANQYARDNNIAHPATEDYKLDTWIKLVMDAMLRRCFLKHYFEGSTLNALAWMGSQCPTAFGERVRARCWENIRCRDLVQSGARGSSSAAAMKVLRQRGLL